jgi:hypothetical protein
VIATNTVAGRSRPVSGSCEPLAVVAAVFVVPVPDPVVVEPEVEPPELLLGVDDVPLPEEPAFVDPLDELPLLEGPSTTTVPCMNGWIVQM